MKILILLSTLAGTALLGSLVARFYMKNQVARYAEFWQYQTGQNGELVYVALGDSSAQGIGASKPENSYVYQLAKLMSEREKRRVKIVNLSKSGSTTQEVIDEQLKNIGHSPAQITTLSVGINDIYGDVPEETIIQNFEAIAKSLPPKSLVAEIPYLMWPKRDKKAQNINKFLRQTAPKYQLSVVPLYEATKQIHFQITAYAPDFFHPNDKGYKAWTNAFWETLENTSNLKSVQ